MSPGHAIAAAVLVALGAVAPAQADAPVKRCMTADGGTIFSDRPCAAFNAVDAPVFARNPGGATLSSTTDAGAVGGFSVRGCARTHEQLASGVREALQARDVNRLANYYHWSGTGSGAAIGLMDRLERIAEHSAGAAEFVYPARPAVFAASRYDEDDAVAASAGPARTSPAAASAWWPRAAGPATVPRDADRVGTAPAASAHDVAAPVPATDPAADPAAEGPRPIGLRVLQSAGPTLPDSPSTMFGLRRNAGCWWIAF